MAMAFTVKGFSSVDYIKKLRQAEFTEQQAEILASEAEQIVLGVLEQTEHDLMKKDLATRKDIKDVDLKIKDIELKIEQVRSELIKWVIGTGIATVLAIAGVIKFMIH